MAAQPTARVAFLGALAPPPPPRLRPQFALPLPPNRNQFIPSLPFSTAARVQDLDAVAPIHGNMCYMVGHLVMRNHVPICLIELKRYHRYEDTFERGEAQALLAAAAIAERHNLPTMRAIVCDFKRWHFLKVNQNGYSIVPMPDINHGVDHNQPPNELDIEIHVQELVKFLTAA